MRPLKPVTFGSLHLGIRFMLAAWIPGILWAAVLYAQEDIYRLEHIEIFGRLRRAPVMFDHQNHMDALDAQGCGVCHHSSDPQTGKAVYVEGEEDSCLACHGKTAGNGLPALREAYHGSCTSCHRAMGWDARATTGPTTCGECHRPAAP